MVELRRKVMMVISVLNGDLGVYLLIDGLI